MQTFLPYPNFEICAKVLDYRRLGKQRVEAFQIWQTIKNGGAWSNHPAVIMWTGFENALLAYQDAMILEWIKRGYKNTMELRSSGTYDLPYWLGDERLHRSHRSNLVRKFPEFYGILFPYTRNDLPYFWPNSSSH